MLRRGSLLSCTLAVLLLVLAVFAAYRLVIEPTLGAYREAERAIEQSQSLLERYRALAAQRAELARRLSEQEELVTGAAGYLEGTSDALVAAELQARVREVVEGAGGELRSTQILPAQPIDGVPIRRAALNVQFAVDIEGLEEILYELETGQPYLFIDELLIRERRARRRRNQPKPEPLLDVRLEVAGYVRAPTA